MRFSRALAGIAVAPLLLLTACGDEGGEGSVEAFCETRAELDDADPFEGIDPESGDVEEAKAAFQEAIDQVDELVDAAPEEIADEVETARDGLNEINDAVQDAESIDEIGEAALSVGGEVAEDAGIEEAGERLEAFEQENCGE